MSEALSIEQQQIICSAAEAMLDEAVAFLQGLLRIPTVNPPGDAYPACAHYIGERLQSLGYSVEYIDLSPEEIAEFAPYGAGLPRTNVIGRLPGARSTPVMHFNGHMDVVPAGRGWSGDPFGGNVREGRIYGRGASDMKGGLAAQVYAIEAIRRAGFTLRGTVEQSGVVDEESTGNRNAGMGLLVERGYIRRVETDYVVITEPLNVDNLCLGHRGALWGEITFIGRQTHSSTPACGLNAIEHIAEFIVEARRDLTSRLQERVNGYSVTPPEASAASLTFTTINGGTNINSVPDRCTVAFDRRLVTGERLEDARSELHELLDRYAGRVPGLRYEYSERYAAEPTWVSDETPLVQTFAQAVESVCGHAPGRVSSPGSDDQRFVVHNAGIEQCIVYGPGEITQAHIIDESLAIADLLASMKVMALATASLLGIE